jgi:hypothetical protein
MVELLGMPSKHEPLSSNSSTAKQQQQQKTHAKQNKK